MAVADFNKDGTPDIAVATTTGVAILLGKGDGTFGEPVPLATGLPLKLFAADLNRDGIADLIVLPADPDLKAAPMFGAAGNSVNVYLGDGKGGFKALPPFPALLSGFTPEGGFPNHMEVADLNGDGVPDLVITKQQYSYETDQTAAGSPVSGRPRRRHLCTPHRVSQSQGCTQVSAPDVRYFRCEWRRQARLDFSRRPFRHADWRGAQYQQSQVRRLPVNRAGITSRHARTGYSCS